MNKLSDAIDHLQNLMDDNQLIGYSSHEELELVLEAAWKYNEVSEDYDE